MKDKEIEIQVRIQESENLKSFLEKEADFISENRQEDEYYTPAHRDFIAIKPIEEWLRVRDENGKYSLTYKKWIYENGIGIYADEYEVEVSNKETAKKILKSIDAKPLITVLKNRRKYLYKNYEVAFDQVVGLGDFVEIEYKGNKEVDPKQTTLEMINFLKNLNCGKIEINNGGYPMLLLFPEDAHFIEV